uniref:Uncharacterized protein n=1 Tax=Arundo donax TaxID=35708 RepID=A0A0A9F785_ARUDO
MELFGMFFRLKVQAIMLHKNLAREHVKNCFLIATKAASSVPFPTPFLQVIFG